MNNLFFKGRVFVEVKEAGKSTGLKKLTDFAGTLAATPMAVKATYRSS